MIGAGVRVGEPEFVSPPCVIGLHGDCADHAPRDSGVPGVRHLICGCACHAVAPTAPTRAGSPEEPDDEGWYRLCWSVRRDARHPVSRVAYGVLIGQDVPALLRGMRGCLSPLAYHDPAHVRALADAPGGWRYETATVAVHTHRIVDRADRTPLVGCPAWKGGETE
ncbi:hypothetical protein [Streptomyces macrosporus]|uniref:Uncharacterized protein n=1 Tax=Streptomyces macrosporus TaxID=44032 RepID=A0ABN3K822_9ACTN